MLATRTEISESKTIPKTTVNLILKGKFTMKESFIKKLSSLSFNSHKSFCLFLCVSSLSVGRERALLALLENSLGLDKLLTFKSLILT